jgi:hypothetical protein
LGVFKARQIPFGNLRAVASLRPLSKLRASLINISNASGVLPVFEVVGGFEPPWKVLQTRALPLGHATLCEIQIRGHKNTRVLLVYQISRQLFFRNRFLCRIFGRETGFTTGLEGLPGKMFAID